MTKADLAQAIQEQTGDTAAEALDHVETTLEIIKGTLEAGTTVKISGFGVFSVRGGGKQDSRLNNRRTKW